MIPKGEHECLYQLALQSISVTEMFHKNLPWGKSKYKSEGFPIRRGSVYTSHSDNRLALGETQGITTIVEWVILYGFISISAKSHSHTRWLRRASLHHFIDKQIFSSLPRAPIIRHSLPAMSNSGRAEKTGFSTLKTLTVHYNQDFILK